MCGIVGYTGSRNATEVLISSLKRLEYRGYDSAGIAVIDGGVRIHKDKGEIAIMERSLPSMRGGVGIAHTRWATCGKPSKENAHPFHDCTGKLALVHNGIIENHLALKRRLMEQGHEFTSETDTEVLVHLVEEYDIGSLITAFMSALREVKGTYAVVMLVEGTDTLFAARNGNPLVIGLGVNENFLASDVTALLDYTNKVIYLLDGDVAEVSPRGVVIRDPDGNVVERRTDIITWSAEDAQKGGFEHFMLKEIFEEPEAVQNTLTGNLDSIASGEDWYGRDLSSVRLVACGTSYHAAMIGKYVLEKVAKVPASVELASEFRYASDVREDPLVVLITQSGETADTLAAARQARRRGLSTLAITNVVGSSIAREVGDVFYTHAGPEIGVAATKTFMTQMVALYLLAMRLGSARKTIGSDALREMRSQLMAVPNHVRQVLDQADQVGDASNMLAEARHAFYLGRNISYPVMLEGALKLKEISYVHAEGYAAGELKHGPLALIDSSTPVVAACVKDHTYDKMLSNITEVKARDAPVIALAQEGDEDVQSLVDQVIFFPDVPPLFSPFPMTATLQLLAYAAARKKGCPIDKPRNLAKSVTVE